MVDGLTGETVELLQAMIRNACVNHGTEDSGQEVRNADTLVDFLGMPAGSIQRFEAAPGRVSIVARLEGTDPDAKSLCLMGHTDVVPVNADGWLHDPFGGELIGDEVWGRGAVDMLNQTASMAVAFRHLANSGFRPKGDLLYFAVADEEAGSAYGAQWIADHHPEAIAADFVLTENGGLHSGDSVRPAISVNIAEKGVAWRRLRIKGTPGHGSMPFKADNALIKAAAVVQRLTDYRPPARFSELWPERVERLGLDPELKAAMLNPDSIDEILDAMPRSSAAPYLHACTHTTFSTNLLRGEDMKANVIPDDVELQVDIRTLPGETADDVGAHLQAALGDLIEDIDVEVIMNDPSSISRADTALWDALARSIAKPFPAAALSPQMIVGFTDARIFRSMGSIAYGAGLFSPDLDAADFSSRFHGHNERIDTESLRLSTDLWVDVATDLLG